MDRRKQRFKKRTAVTKEQALNFLCANEAAEQNREAHQCGKRNSNGITQPSGAALSLPVLVLHRRASEGCNRCDEGQREKFVNVTVVILFVVRVVAAV